MLTLVNKDYDFMCKGTTNCTWSIPDEKKALLAVHNYGCRVLPGCEQVLDGGRTLCHRLCDALPVGTHQGLALHISLAETQDLQHRLHAFYSCTRMYSHK